LNNITFQQAIKNLMTAFSGTTFYVRGPHNVLGLTERLMTPAEKKKSRKSRKKTAA